MPNNNFKTLYKNTLIIFGDLLTITEESLCEQIISAEKRLNMTIPKALADFYQVIEKVKDVIFVFNELLDPTEWKICDNKLIFMTENQGVVYWAIEIGSEIIADPVIFQADSNLLEWELINKKCSEFLVVMLYWEASFGEAAPFSCSAAIKKEKDIINILEKDWLFVGTLFMGAVDEMRVYSKGRKGICFLKWGNNWRIYASAPNEAEKFSLASELGIVWEIN